MKKLYCVSKVSYLLIKHSINYGKCKNEDEKLF